MLVIIQYFLDFPSIHTSHGRHRSPAPDWSVASILPKAEFQEEERNTSKDQHNEVGNEEGTCKI